MRSGIISEDTDPTCKECYLMSLDFSIWPKINCGGVGMFTISLDLQVESNSCEHDDSLKIDP